MRMQGRDLCLEQADDPAGGVEVDFPEAGACSEAGHRLHVAKDGVEEAGARGEADCADGDGEA